MTNDELTATPASKLLAYMQLFRLPNVFTAAADIAMGYFFVRESAAPALVFGLLVAASCLLYTAGMVLNDVCDLEDDARRRPNRPLPSGRISPRWAAWLGLEMLALGVALAWLAGYAYQGVTDRPWRAGAVAMLLAVCILGYNFRLKRTAAGPPMMGLCRLLNVLLGMSVAPAAAATGPWQPAGYEAPQWIVAAGIGLYIAGVTWFARREADESPRLQLAAAAATMTAGIAALGLFPEFGDKPGLRLSVGMWRLLLLLLGVTIVRRALAAAYRPTPRGVQMAVKQCLLSLIVLDAAVCLATRGPIPAIGILTLLLPMLLLGRWVYST